MTAVCGKRPAPKVLSAHVPASIPLTDIAWTQRGVEQI